jgi:uncharacterized cofD-like protein
MFEMRAKTGKPQVVVLGGGNGTSRLLRALLPFLQADEIASLYALVHMADDGGSTGRLREQYAVGAMGDLTKCLLALSSLWGDVRGEQLLRALEYRFANGDFKGHTLRNILLTAFELTSSDIDDALAIMARLVQIPKFTGVIPTTLKALTQQVIIQKNGHEELLGEGQHFISWQVNLQQDAAWKPGDARITFKEKNSQLNPRALQALHRATHLMVAPGHTIGSILPVLASPGLREALSETAAPIYVVMTLLTTPQHTTGWSGEDFVRVYESYLGRPVSGVIANTAELDIPLVPGQDWVRFTEKDHAYELITEDIVSAEEQKSQAGDTVPRAVVIHDSKKLAPIFKQLLL